MKYLSLMAVLAIIYLVATNMSSTHSGVKSSVAQAEEEAAKVDPKGTASPAVEATPATPSLRAPLQRAQEVQSLVKQRNGDDEF